MTARNRAAYFFAGLLCAGVASAQPAPAGDWYASLMSSRQLVAEARFADARVAANDAITAVMNGALVPSRYERQVLVEALVYRAIGESRGMRNDLALWDWYTAVNVDPKVAVALQSQLESAKTLPALESLWQTPQDIRRLGAADRSVTAPKFLEHVDPEYPERARKMRVEAEVVVESIIDATGHPTQPRILTKDVEPTLIVAALNALRRWRFEPARVDSKPVPVIYNLKVTFKLTREK